MEKGGPFYETPRNPTGQQIVNGCITLVISITKRLYSVTKSQVLLHCSFIHYFFLYCALKRCFYAIIRAAPIHVFVCRKFWAFASSET